MRTRDTSGSEPRKQKSLKPYKRVAIDVLDEEQLPRHVAGLVRINDDGSVEWSGKVTVLDRECQDDWAEMNSGSLEMSSRLLQTGRLLMAPLDKAKPVRDGFHDDYRTLLEMLFEPLDVYGNLEILREAYEKALSKRAPDFEDRVRRLRERQGR